MAKLPTYDSKQVLSAEPAVVKRDPSQEGQFGRDIATLGKAAQGVAKVWQDAEDFAQTLERRNFLELETQKVLTDFEANGTFDNAGDYKKTLEDIRNGSLEGFRNNQARMRFSGEVQTQINSAGIKIDGLARKKMIDSTKGNVITQRDINKQSFIKTGDAKFQQKQRDVVKEGAAFLSDVFVAAENVEIDSWSKLRYLQLAGEGKFQDAMDLVQQSDMTPTDKAAAMSSIMGMTKQATIKIELQNKMTENKMIEDAHTYMNQDDVSYVDKLDYLQQQVKFGLPTADAGILKKYLDSANKEVATSYPAAKADLIRRIGVFQNGIGAKSKIKNIRQHLIGVREFRLDIMKKRIKGELTRMDETEILNTLDNVIKEENAYASEQLKEQHQVPGPSWLPIYGHVSKWLNYGYDNAYQDFMISFNNNTANVDIAMVEYFNQVHNKKLSIDERKQIQVDVVDGVKKNLRDMVRQKLIESDPTLKNYRPETKAQIMERIGITDELWNDTMKNRDMTNQQLIEYMRGVKKKK